MSVHGELEAQVLQQALVISRGRRLSRRRCLGGLGYSGSASSRSGSSSRGLRRRSLVVATTGSTTGPGLVTPGEAAIVGRVGGSAWAGAGALAWAGGPGSVVALSAAASGGAVEFLGVVTTPVLGCSDAPSLIPRASVFAEGERSVPGAVVRLLLRTSAVSGQELLLLLLLLVGSSIIFSNITSL